MPQFKHIVLLRFNPKTAREDIAEIFETLDDLPEKVPGLLDVSSGVYDSPEGLHKGFTHGVVMTFADAESRDVYLHHPEHERINQLMLEQLAGGLADLISFDFEASDRFRY